MGNFEGQDLLKFPVKMIGGFGQVWAGLGRFGQVWAGLGRFGRIRAVLLTPTPQTQPLREGGNPLFEWVIIGCTTQLGLNIALRKRCLE